MYPAIFVTAAHKIARLKTHVGPSSGVDVPDELSVDTAREEMVLIPCEQCQCRGDVKLV